MIVRPRVRGHICVTTHPLGCARNVATQIAHADANPTAHPPRSALVVGSSTSYGLGSRIALAFGGGAATFGVFYDRPPKPKRPATPGWYNTAAFETTAADRGINAASYNGDAFSNQAKERVIAALRRGFPPVDCMVYSVAAPRRIHPDTGRTFNSVIKPIGATYRSKTLMTDRGRVIDIEMQLATKDQLNATVLLVGHDTGLMAQFAERGGIMYGGKLVEVGRVEEIFHNPQHPYTQLLISSIPSFETKGEFKGIPGVALSLLEPPSGCLFHPRCPQAMPQCSQRIPPLKTVAPGHLASCLLHEEDADAPAS